MLLLRVLTTAAAGAGLMYLLDPAGGRRRRARVRDRLVRVAHRTGDAVGATSRDVSNRARGVVAELRTRLAPGEVSDGVLHERVRARIGTIIGRASAVEAVVVDGRVTLRGPVLADDLDRLVRRVRAVPGVQEVVDQLDVHDEPGGVPRHRRGGEVLELLQSRWSPSARLFAGLSGAAMTLWGLRRLDLSGILLTAGGAALLMRGISGEPRAAIEALGGRRGSG